MRTCTLPEGGAQDESEPARARTYGGAQSGWTTPIHTGGRLPLYIALHLRAQARVLLMFKRRRAGAVRRHRTPETHMTRAACKYWQIGGQVTYIYAASCTCCRVRRMLRRDGRPFVDTRVLARLRVLRNGISSKMPLARHWLLMLVNERSSEPRFRRQAENNGVR